MKKIALITGATRNIGRAISKEFAKAGYKIIGTYRTGLLTPEGQAEFRKDIPDSELYQVDFCNEKSLSSFINTIKENGIKIDALVNNAGVVSVTEEGVRNEFFNYNAKEFADVVNCNFLATARLSIELKENMNEGGGIVIISSVASQHGAYATISYNASKAALVNLAESLAANYYRYKKVRVNVVSPGWIDSEGGTMGADETSTFMGRVAAVTPMQRNGKPEEVAKMVYFLMTENASFTTGANIFVDGGYSMQNVNYLEEAGYAEFLITLKNDNKNY